MSPQRHADARNDALRTCFEVIADLAAESAEAYRIGGHEVLLVMRGTDTDRAAGVVKAILVALAGRTVNGNMLTAFVGGGSLR